MDCKETLEKLNLLLDGELQPEVETMVMQHLHDCWHCTEIKESEVQLKQVIKEKLAYRKTVPESLAESIRDVIMASH